MQAVWVIRAFESKRVLDWQVHMFKAVCLGAQCLRDDLLKKLSDVTNGKRGVVSYHGVTSPVMFRLVCIELRCKVISKTFKLSGAEDDVNL